MKRLLIPMLMWMVISCSKPATGPITDPMDYDRFLTQEAPRTTSKFFELWNSKLTSDSTQLLSFGPIAIEYTRYFQMTGDIQFLKKAEKALTKAVDIAAINKSGYHRALARNYIAQHRFREALEMALLAERWSSGKTETQQLLFDVHMELGHYEIAQKYLDSLTNFSDFGYLIRVAKWNDHKGDLDTAIHFMEKALQKAESANNRTLKLWTYANIADFYGHAGRIEESYAHYLKALALDPTNAYAKKGIAWIVFSHEKNGKEALRILDSVTQHHRAPDDYLLKADIAQFMGDSYTATLNLDLYYSLLREKAYGPMYNVHTIEFHLDQLASYRKALELAEEELANRATPETYGLLAYAHWKNGNVTGALDIVQRHVEGKTFEPTTLLRMTEIYKAMGMVEQVVPLKQELLDALYELGPMYKDKIQAL